MNAETFMENFGHLADAPGGVAKLRQMVLQLAVQGKLAEQNANDESARKMAARIRDELGLPRSGEVADRTDDSDLPKRWTKCRLADIAKVVYGKGLPTKILKDKGYPVFGANGVIGRYDTYLYEDAQLLISCRGAYSGKINMSPPKCFITNNSLVVELTETGSPLRPYLFHALSGVDRSGIISGTAQPQVTVKNAVTLEVPLPPLAEQKRIVAKVDELMTLCDQLESQQAERNTVHVRLGEAALDRLTTAEDDRSLADAWSRVRGNFDLLYSVPENVSQLRQAIIDLGSKGHLGTQDSSDESADNLILQNSRRHREAWEELERSKLIRKGKQPRNEKWKAKYREPDRVDASGLPLIPEGWAWERIELLGSDPLNTVQTGPFGSQLLKDEFVEAGVPVIAVGNLTGTGFTTDKLYYITPQKANHLCRYDVRAGDVLFARSGATLGKVCVAPPFVDDWRMTGHILRARLNTSVILPDLLVLFLWGSSFVQTQVKNGIRGMTRPGYNTSLLERIVIPIPPIAEQKRIVAKVDELMTLCDQLEAQLTQQQTDADRLSEAMVGAILTEPAAAELVAT